MNYRSVRMHLHRAHKHTNSNSALSLVYTCDESHTAMQSAHTYGGQVNLLGIWDIFGQSLVGHVRLSISLHLPHSDQTSRRRIAFASQNVVRQRNTAQTLEKINSGCVSVSVSSLKGIIVFAFPHASPHNIRSVSGCMRMRMSVYAADVLIQFKHYVTLYLRRDNDAHTQRRRPRESNVPSTHTQCAHTCALSSPSSSHMRLK